VVSIQGKVEVRKQDASNSAWQPVGLQQTYCLGDTIRVKANSRAAVELHNDTILRLNQNTTLVLSGPKKEVSWLDLLKGSLHSISRVPRSLKIKTPFVNAGVEGTEFLVSVDTDNTLVGVIEGKVVVDNEFGRILLAKDQSAITYKGQAPVLRLDIKPTDSVQWSLYYPSLNVVELKPAEDLIRVGQVDAAEALLAGKSSAEALALRSVIAIARNNKDEALKFAQQAIQTNSKSVAAHLSHSYALQAMFDLPAAKAAAQQAIEQDGQHAVAWARLAELQLSLSELDQGLASARRAVELQPELGRTQTILGFAHLLQYETARAKQAFNRSIELDSADPLARLGNGLATIREGDLKQGRREIEIAASLDTSNALVRSYLGKAYLEEKRNKLAADQFALAKQMDPNDPTPWLYDALRKQGENNPVDALRDMQKSIVLNHNRSIYRSKLSIDNDVAAGLSNIGLIFSELDMTSNSLLSQWKAINEEPNNAAPHRSLAAMYNNLPRHEIARVSESLQAQMLGRFLTKSDTARYSESSLGIQDNYSSRQNGLHEYGNLFLKEGSQFNIMAGSGSQSTRTDELSVTGISGNTSYAASQYHYGTDGYRNNNDLEHDLYNALLQVNPTSKDSLQFEFRKKKTLNGDIQQRFGDGNFSSDYRRSLNSDLYRFGYIHDANLNSKFLASIYGVNRKESIFDIIPGVPFNAETSISSDIENITSELQWRYSGGDLKWITGVSYFDESSNAVNNIRFLLGGVPVGALPPFLVDSGQIQKNAYLYFYQNIKNNIALTYGVSLDDVELPYYEDNNQVNPKLGILWDVTDSLSMRMAAFKYSKRALSSNQTLEPTNIAGFNQLYDEVNATSSKNYGIGMDYNYSAGLKMGVEFKRRENEIPTPITLTTSGIANTKELLHHAYINWLPEDLFTLSLEYFYENFSRPIDLTLPVDIKEPKNFRTHRVPLTLGYYPNARSSFKLKVQYVNQNGVKMDNIRQPESDFWISDISWHYKIPKSTGGINFSINNIFDQNFNYQDWNFLSSEIVQPLFIPERSLSVQLHYSIN